jgi:hypothetical protein
MEGAGRFPDLAPLRIFRHPCGLALRRMQDGWLILAGLDPAEPYKYNVTA